MHGNFELKPRGERYTRLAKMIIQNYENGAGITSELLAYARQMAVPPGAPLAAVKAPPTPMPAKPKRAKAPAEQSDSFAPWADYSIPRRYRAARVGPTCVTTFADGVVTRMSTASIPGKPFNTGRGLRNCVAAWQSRTRSDTPRPAVTTCQFEIDGKVVATFDPAEADAAARSA